MEFVDWLKIGMFLSFVLGLGLIYGDVVGFGVLFLVIAIVLLIAVKFVDKKKTKPMKGGKVFGIKMD